MSEPRTVDVSTLPDSAFGPRTSPWWGTLGFMVAEGTTLAICAATYLYLARHYPDWQPPLAEAPDLLLPTVSVLFLVATLVPARMLDHAAHRKDTRAVKRLLVLAVVLEVAALALRAFEFTALNVTWEQNSYGSIVWFILGIHTTLLAADLGETGVFAGIFLSGRIEEKHYADTADVAFYWRFVVLAWVPLYLLVYLSPRVFG